MCNIWNLMTLLPPCGSIERCRFSRSYFYHACGRGRRYSMYHHLNPLIPFLRAVSIDIVLCCNCGLQTHNIPFFLTLWMRKTKTKTFFSWSSWKILNKLPTGKPSWRICHIFYLRSRPSEFFPTGCQWGFDKLSRGGVSCYVMSYLFWMKTRKRAFIRSEAWTWQMQDSCRPFILSPRWRNLHIQVCSYKTTGMCSRLNVATGQNGSQEKYLKESNSGTRIQNPSEISQELNKLLMSVK